MAKIIIALTEAVNNAIHHGNALDPSKTVTLGYEVKDDRIIFMVQDQGPGFDYEHLPDPTDPQNIEKPHGRGVFLMRALAKSVEFSDNGATVTMAFSLATVPGITGRCLPSRSRPRKFQTPSATVPLLRAGSNVWRRTTVPGSIWSAMCS